jgi:predicted dehydrogenase
MKTPVRVVVVGAGDRAMIYARESLAHPELFQVVGVADVSQERVRRAQELFSIPQEHCFSSAEELAAHPKFADAVINGTMDRQHVSTSLPLLRRGYDMLLEKPFAVNQEEAQELLRCAQETGCHVMVCHVLRYSSFYRQIKELVERGEIGEIINIRMAEQVSFFHESVSYVRGKYALPEICGSGMLLSKCSHDLDIMAWLMNSTRPAKRQMKSHVHRSTGFLIILHNISQSYF